VIDLDQAARRRPPPDGGWRRLVTGRVLILVAVGSFVAGVVLGGVVMHRWRYQPLAASVEAGKSVVSVLLFARSDVTTVLDQQGRVRAETQVTVVNAGPETVNVLALRVDQPGVTVRSPERERQVQPGTATVVDVVVEWDCKVNVSEVLAASVSVETADEQLRQLSPVDLDGTPWIEIRRRGCSALG
jgi:hypothetical protein